MKRISTLISLSFLGLFFVACSSQDHRHAAAHNYENRLPSSTVTQTSSSAALASVADSSSSAANRQVNSSYPINAEPGQCYARVTYPAVVEKANERVQVAPEGTKIINKPGEYRWVKKPVVVKSERTVYRTIPATYKKETERVMVRPESRTPIRVPATYKTVREKVLVSPATTKWVKGKTGVAQKINAQTGEHMCLVNVPAKYDYVSKKVLVTPEGTRYKTVPAQYQTVSKTVVAEPARVVTKVIPAVTKTVRVKELVREPTSETIVTPAKYKTISRTVVVKPSSQSWEQVLCQTNASTSKIKQIQTALKRKGFNPGTPDGHLGQSTYQALKRYQKANRLASGAITVETLRALNVTI